MDWTSRPGKTVFLLGQSMHGASLSPISPKSNREAIQSFGPPDESPLTHAYMAGHEEHPDTDYVLMRINGVHATAEVDGLLFEATFTPAGESDYYQDWEVFAGTDGIVLHKEIDDISVEHHLLYRDTLKEMVEEAEYLSFTMDQPFPVLLSTDSEDLPGNVLQVIPPFTLDGEVHHVLSFPLKMQCTSTKAGESYNSIEISADDTAVLVQTPSGEQYSFAHTDTPTLGELLEAWQRKEQLMEFPLTLSIDRKELGDSILNFPTSLLSYVFPISTAGGDDDYVTDADSYFLLLQEAYELLEGVPMDVIVPLGAFFNTPHEVHHYGEHDYGDIPYTPSLSPLTLVDAETQEHVSFHRQLLEFIRYQRGVGLVTHGMINLLPRSQKQTNRTWIQELETFDSVTERNGFVFRNQDGPVDEGGHISIVAQGVETEHGWIDGAVVYAGAWVQSQRMTNVIVVNQNKAIPQIQPDVAKEFAARGILSFTHSHRRGYVVAYGITAGLPNSDWSNADHIRAVQITLQHVEPLLSERIGSVADLDRLEESLNEVLGDLKEQRILASGRAEIHPDDNKVYLRYRPRHGLRELTAIGGGFRE